MFAAVASEHLRKAIINWYYDLVIHYYCYLSRILINEIVFLITAFFLSLSRRQTVSKIDIWFLNHFTLCHQALIIFISNIFNFIPQNYTTFTQYLLSKHFHYMHRKKEILSAGLMKMQFKRYKRLLFNPTKFFLNHLLNFNQLRNYCIGVSEQARERDGEK